VASIRDASIPPLLRCEVQGVDPNEARCGDVLRWMSSSRIGYIQTALEINDAIASFLHPKPHSEV